MATEREEILRVEVDYDAAGKNLTELEKQLQDIKKQQSEYNKTLKAGEKLSADQQRQYAENVKKLDQVKKAQKQTTNEVVTGIKKQKGSLVDLRENLKRLVDQRNKISLDTKEGQKAVKDLNKEIKGLNEGISEVEQGGGDFRRNVGNYASGFDALGVPVSGFVNGLGSATKAALAFIATPLGLILSALAVAILAVKTAFESSEEGQNKFAKISAVIGAVIGNLTDLLADLGELIIGAFEEPQKTIDSFAKLIKENIINRFEGMLELFPAIGEAISKLFDGDFSGAAKVATDAVLKVTLGIEDFTDKAAEGFDKATEAVKRFSEEQVKEAGLAASVADKRAKADKLERTLLVERARLESEIAELRLKSRQEDQFSAAERREAIIEAQALQDQLLQQEQEVLQLRSDAITLENTFSRSNKENLDAEAKAKADVLRSDAARLNQQRTTQRELNKLNREVEAEEKASQKERDDRAKKRLEFEEQLRSEKLKTKELEATTREEENEAAIEREEFEAEQRIAKIEKEVEEEQLKADLIAEINEQLAAKLNAIAREETKVLETEKEKQKKIAELTAAAEVSITQQALGVVSGLLEQGSNEYKAVKIVETVISTATGIQKALAEPLLPYPTNVIQAGLIGATGAVNIATIAAAAGGGDFVTNGATLLLVGDNPGGQERVRVDPIGARGATRTAGSNLSTISGNREGDSAREQTQMLSSALRSMPPPVLVVKDYQKAAKRVEVKQSIAGL